MDTDLAKAVPLVATASVATASVGHLRFGDLQLGLAASILVGAIPSVSIGAHVPARTLGALILALTVVKLTSGRSCWSGDPP